MRGEKEALCFNRIKEVFYGDFDFKQNYFGLLENERSEFVNIIRTATPNPLSSEFPDFVFENGFIEHFQITSYQADWQTKRWVTECCL